MEAGTNFGIVDDQLPSAHRLVTTNHLVTLLNNAGISWKTYQEDVPPAAPRTTFSPTSRATTPLFSLTTLRPMCVLHQPYPGRFRIWRGDLTNNLVARYNFITPNQTK